MVSLCHLFRPAFASAAAFDGHRIGTHEYLLADGLPREGTGAARRIGEDARVRHTTRIAVGGELRLGGRGNVNKIRITEMGLRELFERNLDPRTGRMG